MSVLLLFLNTVTAFYKQIINHENSLFQIFTPFSLNFDH